MPGHFVADVSISGTLSASDAFVARCLLPLALFILLNGIDDLLLDCVLTWDFLRRRRRPAAARETLSEKRIAIFVPLWQEHEVIRGMIAHNIAAIRYQSYDFFVGAYPNDYRTLAAVRELEERFPNLHVALCPHEGPTSKADCLNWLYQRMLLFEEEHESRFDLVVVHDAEDLIHPDALASINLHSETADMVQIPVLPLATPMRELIHGVYCDEFAEYQTRDVPARRIVGSFLPSNGVGTGFSRRALEALAVESGNRVFDPVCLTEDYEIGLRLHALGFRQEFVALRGGSEPIATREYFPRKIRAAIRQRTRWITGISLQSWARNGWRGGLRQNYWFWRDRKGLLTNPVSLITNLLFGYGALTWVAARLSAHPWGLGRHSLHPALFVVILLLQLLQMGIRIVSVARYFGWRFSCGVPIRMLVANAINCTATLRAEYRFVRALLLHEPLLWLKTEHAYPSQAALRPHRRRLGEILTACGYISAAKLEEAAATQPPGIRIGEHLVALGLLSEDELYAALGLQQGLPAGPVPVPAVSARVARSLPRAVMKRWKVLPVEISDGRMMLASPEIPGEEMTGVLGSLTKLKLEFHLVTPVNFAELRNAFL